MGFLYNFIKNNETNFRNTVNLSKLNLYYDTEASHEFLSMHKMLGRIRDSEMLRMPIDNPSPS